MLNILLSVFNMGFEFFLLPVYSRGRLKSSTPCKFVCHVIVSKRCESAKTRGGRLVVELKF